jgi:hypothetical protein
MDRAQAHVYAFLLEAYGPNRGFLGENFNEVANGLREFIKEEPLPGGRVVKGQPIDLVAPSFWHACCSVFFDWSISRFAADDGTTQLKIYRGQTNPWPLRSSLWRSTDNMIANGSAALSAFQTFLRASLRGDPDPSYEHFSPFLEAHGIAALAQHHGFPTNLIDFTFDPLVALYFASRPASKATVLAGVPNGHGVIFECHLSNLKKVRKRSGVTARYELLPPIHVGRFYQQRGILVDCGDPRAQHADSQLGGSAGCAELERACTRIFFPRAYPEMKGLENAIEDHMMAYWMSEPKSVWHTPQTAAIQDQWYLVYHWYAEPFEALRSYCSTAPAQFDSASAIRVMSDAIENDPPPWSGHIRFMESSGSRAQRLAEYFATAAAMVADVAKVFCRPGWRLDRDLVVQYARSNPVFFSALFELASKVDLYSLPNIKQAVAEALGDEVASLAGALSDSQRTELRSLPRIEQQDPQVLRFLDSI